MIYLIGGAPRLGKSVLAKALMMRTGTPWLSSDALSSACYQMIQKEERDRLFPYEGAEDSDKVYKKSIAATVRDQLIESRSMRRGVYACLQQHLDTGNPFILEGVHLLPKDVAVFIQRNSAQKKNIRVLYLVDSDPKNVLRGLLANTDPHDWLKGAKPKTYEKVAEFIVALNEYIQKEAKKYRLPIFMRTSHFQKDLRTCITMLRT